MSRRWLLLIPAGLLLAVVVVAVVLLRGSTTTKISVDEAVGQFRDTAVPTSASTISATTTPAATTTTAAPTTAARAITTTTVPIPPVARPETGVYVYTTTGFDSVDALTGARHNFPATTTVTISAAGCGVDVRWNTVRERWDEWQWCPQGRGIETVAYRSFHQFFGVSSGTNYQCAGDPLPLAGRPGSTWTIVCRQGDSDTSRFIGHLIGRQPVKVGTTSVNALRIRYDVAVSGVSAGTKFIDRWIRPEDGLVLREDSGTDTVQSTALGKVHYRERYTIVLQSLVPRR
ncbi:MAG TPA: hypothetical protein VH419_12465 [Nocardioidaceae bacterium]|jgi:hypothetical protein